MGRVIGEIGSGTGDLISIYDMHRPLWQYCCTINGPLIDSLIYAVCYGVIEKSEIHVGFNIEISYAL